MTRRCAISADALSRPIALAGAHTHCRIDTFTPRHLASAGSVVSPQLQQRREWCPTSATRPRSRPCMDTTSTRSIPDCDKSIPRFVNSNLISSRIPLGVAKLAMSITLSNPSRTSSTAALPSSPSALPEKLDQRDRPQLRTPPWRMAARRSATLRGRARSVREMTFVMNRSGPASVFAVREYPIGIEAFTAQAEFSSPSMLPPLLRNMIQPPCPPSTPPTTGDYAVPKLTHTCVFAPCRSGRPDARQPRVVTTPALQRTSR
jgi:hypothetical protein